MDAATARDPALIKESIERLEVLVTQVRQRGYRANLVAVIDRVPRVTVQNPHEGSGRLQESVYAAPRGADWRYWWSWAEVIAESDDAAVAAARIVHVLRDAG